MIDEIIGMLEENRDLEHQNPYLRRSIFVR